MEIEIEIYTEPISHEKDTPRRQAELDASAKMIMKAFGVEASLTHDEEGRPLVSGACFNGMISISHSVDQCVLAVTRSTEASIGIDTEVWRDQLRRVAPKFLSAEEIEVYTSPTQLLLAWTTKEAVYKAACTPGLPLKEIKLPIPAPLNDTFTAEAYNRTFHVTSLLRSAIRATTTAYFIENELTI